MRCTICKKSGEEVFLLEGIYNGEMIRICEPCSDSEGIVTIKKPSDEQLQKADERYTVRERMEKLSGVRDTTEISEEQTLVQGNIAKLRMPAKKQYHDNVLDNYYWTLNIARRRKKLSIKQLAEKIGIDEGIILSIEKGKIPEDFEEYFLKLEAFLGIKLLKNHENKISFVRDNRNYEQEILKKVGAKMTESSRYGDDSSGELERNEKMDMISRGEVDFSKKGIMGDITLNDLVEMKRRREKKEGQKKKRIQTDAMLGDEIELDIEEV